MCPLRFILVFFSAVIAGYLAWRTVRSSPEVDLSLPDLTADSSPSEESTEFSLKKVVQEGFWVFVDMASGKYLWRNFKEMRAREKAKSC
ncbi:hypothetical protein SAY87_030665 [Trapa incisa]|uniref:Methyltransferase-related protein n=2 Tax=Trapa TaxID=22665 RepID=A0AAN7LT94_TRANT|nr:hypothetical protein SAY87_030665 [Trapa incisa]KAK4787240.1 hypothetical protein SAY86_011073 [Trapa natans]